ncbi:hypothetical protein LINPERPRIM_LOCUS20082 [Linum perenne]
MTGKMNINLSFQDCQMTWLCFAWQSCHTDTMENLNLSPKGGSSLFAAGTMQIINLNKDGPVIGCLFSPSSLRDSGLHTILRLIDGIHCRRFPESFPNGSTLDFLVFVFIIGS